MNFVTANELGKLVSDLKKENAKLREWNSKYSFLYARMKVEVKRLKSVIRHKGKRIKNLLSLRH